MPPEPSHRFPKIGVLQVPRNQRINRSLDDVPMRTGQRQKASKDDTSHDNGGPSSSRTRNLPKQVVYPQLPTLSTSSSSATEQEESYSPTTSEIDALEESFFDYEIQSSNVLDNVGPGISAVAAQQASSANYIQNNDDDASSTTSSSYLSLPETADETLVEAPKSLKERLHSVWRTF